MRMIGNLPDERSAKVFGDYLVALGMDNSVEESGKGDFAVWVEHDDHLERAKVELEGYRTNPGDAKYQGAVKQAESLRAEREKAAEKRRKNYTDVRTSWAQAAGRPTPVTVAIMVLCLVVAVATSMGARESAVEPLFIVPVLEWVGEDHVVIGTLSDTVHRHQYWRFISPIFMHAGFLHLFFNMSMLLNFGGMIERHKGSWMLIAIILLSAIPSNLAQYLNPVGVWLSDEGRIFAFGGMSGVVYALFGYIWMKSRYQPHEGMRLDLSTVYFLMIWLVLCMVIFTGIANTAHVVGLACGMALGAGPFYWKQLRRRAAL
jgi:GlpG protein